MKNASDTMLSLRIPQHVMDALDSVVDDERKELDPSIEIDRSVSRSSIAKRFIVFGLREAGYLKIKKKAG